MPQFDAKAFLKTLTSAPGVYRMLDAEGMVLYVGKARDLKRRVSSYFRRNQSSLKTRSLMAQVADVEITVTNTETEALLLENNLIKQHRPRYNVLLRDDKSYPYIHLTSHQFPRLRFYRGARREKGSYFGPYASTVAVRDTLNYLQKLFQIRSCSDSFFANRSRPCLQYQIKRCTAPCVNYISAEDYQQDIDHAVMFLQGRNREVIDALVRRMEQASSGQDYEQAAQYRDQIVQLRQTTQRQYVSGDINNADADAIAISYGNGVYCIAVMFIRNGRNLGSKIFFPRIGAKRAATGEAELATVLDAFLAQYYIGRPVPVEILLNSPVESRQLLEQAFSEQTHRKVVIKHRLRGERSRWQALAQRNAEQALTARLAANTTLQKRFADLQKILQLDQLPTRLECFDISHTMGEATVASCVVFGLEGAIKSDYRRFNIADITPGDDYAALYQALTRRYTRLKKGEGKLPDILFIDGGKGQVTQAARVLEELQIPEILLVGIAKGPERKPGLEELIIANGEKARVFHLPPDSMALHLIQQVRDEAHRFAISGHRARRAKTRRSSPLETIEGLGPKRRQLLLKQFGGLQGVSRAGIDDLTQISGISKALAQRIYDCFHAD
ncbi:MAG TPA: excinuclease ABC subunit UvrC [Gammaproteobacteria bacterium]|nr:excinuclease ABC subunit UvrC [Gammaproteobacteria bacterium]